MLKSCNLSRNYLLQIAKRFLGIKLLRIKTSYFIGSSERIELVFDNTAKKFSAQILEKNSKLKDSKENHFVQIFRLGTYKAVWEPRRNFLAELSNVFPSQSEQMCKFLNIPKQHFFLNFCLRTLQFQFGQSWLFFVDCPNSSRSKS